MTKPHANVAISDTIMGLQEHVERVRQGEIVRFRRRLGSLSADQRNALESLTRGIVNEVLRAPITALNAHARDEDPTTLVVSTRRAFGLGERGGAMSTIPKLGAAFCLAVSVLMSTTAFAASARLEPATQAFIDGLSGPPLYTLTPDAARGVLSGAQKSVKVALPAVSREDRVLNLGPLDRTRIRITRPAGTKGPLPVVVYMHGGGWVLGDKETHDRLVSELAVGAEAVIVFVDYDRSPENRFPVAIEEGYAVAKYVAGHGAEFGADPSRLAIAGDSVGGNMTAVLALMAKERGGPSFTAQVLLYPVTDASLSTASYSDFAEGPWLTKKAMEWFWDAYLPDKVKRSDIHVSPLNASLEQLKGLPPALVLVDENDVLRDKGEAYANKLAQAGVRVTSVRYNGTIHDFMLLNPIATTPAVRSAVDQTCGYLRKALATKQP